MKQLKETNTLKSMNLLTLPLVVKIQPISSTLKATRTRILMDQDLYAPWLKGEKGAENVEL
jgi:hypothetical protein